MVYKIRWFGRWVGGRFLDLGKWLYRKYQEPGQALAMLDIYCPRDDRVRTGKRPNLTITEDE